MKKMIIVGLVVVVGVAAFYGCSQEDRDEVTDRLSTAGKALTGDVRSNDERTPRIVKEQQRKERKRQDSTWTPENRAAHPIEYCQAQLEELTKYATQLEATAHEVACNQAAMKRQIADNEAMVGNLEKFLAETKKTYRACEAANSWPAKVGGFSLSQEKTKEKIVEAAQKLTPLQARVATQKNQLAHLDKKAAKIAAEQKRLVAIRDGINNTINDLRLKKVIEGENGIADALNAINDNMTSLGVDYDDPKIEDLVIPDSKATADELFNKVMAE